FNLSELFVQITRYLNFKNLLKEVSTKEIINQTDIEFQNLSFSKKLEEFFIQTNYCLVLNPEVLLLSEKGNINLMLEPQHYIKIINDYQIDCPFVIEEKIQELKNLMIKENISVEDGISIFESYKNYHNPIDSVLIFQPILDLLNKGLKRINPLISEKEITKEHISLNNYYIGIKNDFHNQLYKSLFTTESVILNNTKRDELNITNKDTQLSSEFVESELRLKIKKYLNFYQEQCPRKHKQILKDEDFNKLIEWTF